MESQVVRRRVNTISGHFAARSVSEDVSAATTQLFPLNCSSNLNTAFRRLDNRIHYGRQASHAQGYFMRQAETSIEQNKPVQLSSTCSANNSREDKSAPLFSRPGTGEPLFSRPARRDFSCSNASVIEPLKQEKTMLSAPACPKFARPCPAMAEANQCKSRRQMMSSQINGIGWSPRINVAESKSNHVITVELPGVNIGDIRVEMDDKNIIVKGKRSMKWWKSGGSSKDSFSTYHKMEISHGPYQVVWPLPAGANKDAVSAEFVEGILHITIPKI